MRRNVGMRSSSVGWFRRAVDACPATVEMASIVLIFAAMYTAYVV